MNSKDKEIYILKIKLAKLSGLFVGTLNGILFWDDLPEELRDNLKKILEKLEKNNI